MLQSKAQRVFPAKENTFFSNFFFIANFSLVCRKCKSSVVTAQPFFLFPPCVITIYYAGNPYLCYGAKIILPPPTQYPPSMSFPPPPSAPGGGGYHGRSGGWGNGKLYLATQKARAAAARRKEARANLLAPPPPSTPSNRAARYKICSDEKSLSEAPPATKLPRKKGKSIVWNNGIKRR